MFRRNKGAKKATKKEKLIVTKESLCSTCALFSLLALLILCTRTLIFGEVGKTIHIFLTGLLGYFAFPVILGVLYLSITGLLGKRLVKKRKLGFAVAVTLIFIGFIVQTATTYSWSLDSYLRKCFLAGDAFPNTTPCGLLGGFVVFAICKLITKMGALVLFSSITVFLVYFCYVLAKKKAPAEGEEKKPSKKRVVYDEQPKDLPLEAPVQPAAIPLSVQSGQADYTLPTMHQKPGVTLEDAYTKQESYSPFSMPPEAYATQQPMQTYDSKEVFFGGSPAENYRKNLLFDPNARVNQRPNVEPAPPLVQSSYTPSYTGSFTSSMNEEKVDVQPAKVVSEPAYNPYEVKEEEDKNYFSQMEEDNPFASREEVAYKAPETDYGVREPEPERESFLSTPREEPRVEETRGEEISRRGGDEGYQRHDYMGLFSTENPNVFGNEEETARFGRDFADRAMERGSAFREEEEARRSERDNANLFDEEEEKDIYTLRDNFESPRVEESRDTVERTRGENLFSEREAEDRVESRGRDFTERGRDFVEERPAPAPVAEPPKPEPPKPRIIRPYVRPRLDDFDCRDIEPTSNDVEVQMTKDSIIATLEEFKITGASIASVTFGPTVTRYNVTIPRSISPKKVVALDQSIAIDLHSNGVNIYPNYEDGVVSIEVPNKDRQFVQLGCMLSGDTFVNAKPSSLMFAMGKDVANRKIYGDISKMIHLLVAGSSGSGKSVFLGSLIVSLIYKYSPEELRLILIDPKKTEFVLYNNLPHLMINEIITEPGKAVQSLNWAIGEMNRRYSLFEKMSRSGKYVVNLDQYNEQLEKAERLPKIVIIIDELADLMLAAKKEMEDRIQNLTQKARAAGIHLIVATQRPSTDVITGVIKSNLATRVAFYVATDVDSRVILDQTGAQKLLGKGDFLYTMPGINVPVRVQSAFTSPEESQRVVNFIKNNNECYYDEEATAYINSRGGNVGDPSDGSVGSDGSVDPMYIEALRYVVQSNSASISMIQRKCSAGYNRAGKIIEWMEDMGYISPFDGAKARKVLLTKEEFESKYGPL